MPNPLDPHRLGFTSIVRGFTAMIFLMFGADVGLGQSIRFATYNLHGGVPVHPVTGYCYSPYNGMREIASVINSNKLDVVVVQHITRYWGSDPDPENPDPFGPWCDSGCNDQPLQLGSFTGMSYWFKKTQTKPAELQKCGYGQDRESGLAIFSKYPISAQWTPNETSSMQLGQVNAFGKTLNVGNIHFSLTESVRADQAAEANDFMISHNPGSDHEFLGGDWNNAGPVDPALNLFRTSRHHLHCPIGTAGDPCDKIDHIFGGALNTTDDTRLMKRWEGVYGPSDHVAQIIQFYLGPPPVELPVPINPQKYYRIMAKQSARSLDVAWASQANGAAVLQQYYAGGTNQHWRFSEGTNLLYHRKIIARHSNKCLEFPNGFIEDGRDVRQWECNGGANQEWLAINESTVGMFRYYSLSQWNVQKYLEIEGGNEAVEDGKVAQLWQGTSNDNQRWFFVEVPEELSAGWSSLGGGLTTNGAALANKTTGRWISGNHLDGLQYSRARNLYQEPWQPPSVSQMTGFVVGSVVDTIDGNGCQMTFLRRTSDNVLALDMEVSSHSFGCVRPGTPTFVMGPIYSAPAATSWGSASSQRYDVFATDSNGYVMQSTYTGTTPTLGTWSPWVTLAGPAMLGSDPAAVSMEPGRIDLFVQGTDNMLYWRKYSSGAWGAEAWVWLGGPISSSPAVSSPSPGTLFVYARGTDNNVWRRKFSSGSWDNFASCGGPVGSKPAAGIISGSARVFARGFGDNALWTRVCD